MFLAAPRGTVAVTGEPISSLACRGTRAVRQQALVMLALEHNLQELTSSIANANFGYRTPPPRFPTVPGKDARQTGH